MKHVYFNLKTAFIALIALVGTVVQMNAQNLSFQWANRFGDQYSDNGKYVKTDGDGNVYTTGWFQGTADFDPGPGTVNLTTGIPNSGQEIYIAKYDAAGGLLWAKAIGGKSGDGGSAIALDKAGNVYVTGFFGDTVDFDPGAGVTNLSCAGGADAFILKLRSNGDFVWAKSIGGAGNENTYGIDVDAKNNVYTLGSFTNVADFDPGPVNVPLTSAGAQDIFISKLDSNGNYIWAKRIGGQYTDQANGIVIDPKGYICLVGVFSSSVDFDPGIGNFTLTTTPYYLSDAFISKFDTAGNFIWAKQIGGVSNDVGNGIALDTAGNVYTTGYFYGLVDFDPSSSGYDTLRATGFGADIFVSKLNKNGDFVMGAKMGGTGDDYSYSIALDKFNNIFTTGFFNGTADFNPGPGLDTLRSFGGQDIFISKLDNSGNYVWSKQMGGTMSEAGASIAVNTSGDVYTTGAFSDKVDFDPSPATFYLTTNINNVLNSASDIFLEKLVCGDTSSASLTVTLCNDNYILAGQLYTASGIYKQRIPNAAMCDSTITLDLTLRAKLLNPIITVNVFVLGTTAPYGTYQWLLNGAPIQGATDSTYTVTVNGNYSVVVTGAAGCTDTSIAYPVTNVTGVNNITAIAQGIKIYPNPATDVLHIASPIAVNVAVSSIDGKNVMQVNDAKNINIHDLANGMYLLRISDANGTLLRTDKFIKNN